MSNQQILEKEFKHLLSIQNDVIFFYERLAHITTEKDLKRIFFSLANYHKSSKKKIEQQFFSNKNEIQAYLERGHSFFKIKWKNVLAAVLVNDKKQLIEYCEKSELDLLEKVGSLIRQNDDKENFVKALSFYENQLLTYLNKLNHLPNKKIYHSKAA